MGIFSEIDMDMRQGDSPFATDTNRPLDTASHSAPAAEAQMAVSDPFSNDTPPESAVTGPAAEHPEEDTPLTEAEAEEQAAEEGDSEDQDTGEKAPAQTDEAADKDAKNDAEEEAKRKAHEESEAKRKAEFEAKQAKKKAAEKEQLARLSAMGDDEVMMASMKHIAADTERLTRRNMKLCVSEHIQTKCLDDPAFARKTMHPRKSMIHCIWYINRKAKEYLQEEMKLNEEKPDANGMYGGDVPDELCYKWAEDYYNDPDAKEDQEKEEKFVPKPYTGKAAPKPSKTAKPAKEKKEQPKKEVKKPEPQKKADDSGQMSLLGDFGALKESA